MFLPAVEKGTIFVDNKFISGLLINCFDGKSVTSEGSKQDDLEHFAFWKAAF